MVTEFKEFRVAGLETLLGSSSLRGLRRVYVEEGFFEIMGNSEYSAKHGAYQLEHEGSVPLT